MTESLSAAFVTRDEAAAMITGGSTVAITGSGGGILEPSAIFEGVRDRFEREGAPSGLTLVHSLGIGHASGRGLELWADPRLVRRVIGGHWSWSPTMQKLATSGEIEAYAWPAGVISLLLREIGAGRPGLITRTGLHTVVDPRHGGGRFTTTPSEDLVRLTRILGRDYLHYLPFAVDVGIIRGTFADDRGNISCAEEPASLDVLAVAQAAKASGGVVVAQVRERVPRGALDPRLVDVPAGLVDAVVVTPGQWQTYESPHNASYAGTLRAARRTVDPPDDVPITRRLVAGRAAREVRRFERTNVGFGMASDVVDVLSRNGRLEEVELLIEQGTIGGVPIAGELFGVSRDFDARLSSTAQFDLFASGVLDRSVLGLAEVGPDGSVNVSAIGDRLIGPGGFIEISQHTRHAVFCGTFTTRGLRLDVDGDAIRIAQEGAVRKFVDPIRQTTYSGSFAVEEGRSATYVTERAVFSLRPGGIELTEVVDGVDIERDILAHMDFTPIIGEPAVVGVYDYGLTAFAGPVGSGAPDDASGA